MSGSGPERAPFSGSESSSLGPQPHRPWSTPKRLQRAVVVTEIGGLVLFELLLWLSSRRRHLRWRAQGAFERWENDVRRGPRRPGSQASGRRSRGGRSRSRG